MSTKCQQLYKKILYDTSILYHKNAYISTVFIKILNDIFCNDFNYEPKGQGFESLAARQEKSLETVIYQRIQAFFSFLKVFYKTKVSTKSVNKFKKISLCAPFLLSFLGVCKGQFSEMLFIQKCPVRGLKSFRHEIILPYFFRGIVGQKIAKNATF